MCINLNLLCGYTVFDSFPHKKFHEIMIINIISYHPVTIELEIFKNLLETAY